LLTAVTRAAIPSPIFLIPAASIWALKKGNLYPTAGAKKLMIDCCKNNLFMKMF
jgi:hypothetical protein